MQRNEKRVIWLRVCEMCIDIQIFMHANDALNRCVAIWFDELA